MIGSPMVVLLDGLPNSGSALHLLSDPKTKKNSKNNKWGIQILLLILCFFSSII